MKITSFIVVLAWAMAAGAQQPKPHESYVCFDGKTLHRCPAPAAQTPAKKCDVYVGGVGHKGFKYVPCPAAQTQPPKITDLHWSGKVWVEGPAAQTQPESGGGGNGDAYRTDSVLIHAPAEHQVEIRPRREDHGIAEDVRSQGLGGAPQCKNPDDVPLTPPHCNQFDYCTPHCYRVTYELFIDGVRWGTLKYSEGK